MFLADLCADVFHRLVNVAAHGPLAAAATNFLDEIAENGFALGCVHYFRVKLQSEKFALPVFHRGVWGIFRDRYGLETFGQFREFIPVGIPHLQAFGQFAEERAPAVFNREGAFAVLAFETAFNFASEEFRHHL